MSDTQQQHRRRRSRSEPSRSRSSSRRPSFGFVLRGGLIALLSIAGAAWIIGHASTDAVPPVDIGDPGWRSDGAAADLAQGQAALQATPADVEAARTAARAALSASPLNLGALDILAAAAKSSGDDAAAGDFYRLILDRSWRDLESLRWKLDRMYEEKNWEELTLTADALLRADNQKSRGRYAIAMLVALSGNDEIRPYILERSRQSGLWRRSFLTALATLGPIDVFPDFMTELGYTDTSASSWLWSPYLARLMRQGESRKAYAIWAGLLPPEQLEHLGYVFNGSFEVPLTSMPFDWSLTATRGIELGVVNDEAADGASSLRITFGGAPVDFRNVQQMMILDPGNYRLAGAVKTEDLKTERGLFWRIYCAGNNQQAPVASSPPFSGTSPWSRFSVDFTIPETGCDRQLLRLELPARISAERNIKGRIWLDSLTVQSESAESSATASPDG